MKPTTVGNPNDRLSNLPDDILLSILDRLNVREAARTSTLSRRWRCLPAMLSRLMIHFGDFLPNGVTTFSADELVRTNAAVVEATKSILGHRDKYGANEHTAIELLSVSFYLRDRDSISIGRAVGHTMATHKVDMAEFMILTERKLDRCDDDDLIDYGRWFMKFFYVCPIAFGGLTSLAIGNLRFCESDVPNILRSCKRLKYLRLFNCDSGIWTVLQVEHPQLNVLSIAKCRFESFKLNWLPKLTKLIFEDWISFQDPLTLGYVPLLDAVRLTNVGLSWHKMVNLSKFLRKTSVRDLALDFKSEKIWVQPELPQKLASVFNKLRFVNLFCVPEGCDLTWTLFILQAAPALKELYMTVWDHSCEMEMDEERRRALSYSDKKNVEWSPAYEPDFKHQSLAVLTIFGFQSEDYFVSYIKRVMELAVNLEDVFLYKSITCERCKDKSPKPPRFPWTKRQRSSLKKRITQGTSFAIVHFSTLVIRSDHLAKMCRP